MPVEDPRALAKTYMAKHNVEKIFEVIRQPSLRAAHRFRPGARIARGSTTTRGLRGTTVGGVRRRMRWLTRARVVCAMLLFCVVRAPAFPCSQNLQAHVLIDKPENVREYMIEYLTNMKKVCGPPARERSAPCRSPRPRIARPALGLTCDA